MTEYRTTIRLVSDQEAQALGQLMVEVYQNLPGFPTPEQQPNYYAMLADIASMNQQPHTAVLVALSETYALMGGVVYFSDMSAYASGGTATQVKQASGIRLLGVDPQFRGRCVGTQLALHCVDQARMDGNDEVILHTTAAMPVAWKLYLKLGFKRDESLDFKQNEMAVYGFRLHLK